MQSLLLEALGAAALLAPPSVAFVLTHRPTPLTGASPSIYPRSTTMALDVSAELVAKLAMVGDQPIADSTFASNRDGTKIERVLGTRGVYVSSEADNWVLRGPFDAAL